MSDPRAFPRGRRPRSSAGRAALACALSALALSSCAQRATPVGAAPLPSPPLAVTVATPEATWTTVKVGAYWELLRRPRKGSTWSLATPPGVDDGGGLVLAGAPDGSLTVGFRPTDLLRFSPLEATGDGGRTWSQGLLPGGLANGADTLSSGPGGRAWALLQEGGGEVVARSSPGSPWRRVVSAGSLRSEPVASPCGVEAISSVLLPPSGSGLVAAVCDRPGTAGIFAEAAGAWRAAGPQLPPVLRTAMVRVVRVTATGGGLVALLLVRSAAGASIIAAWGSSGATDWRLSAPLPLGTGTPPRLLEAAIDPQGAGYVLLGAAGHRLALARATRASATWQGIPPPPGSVTSVAIDGERIDAFQPRRGSILDWRLDAAAGVWREAASIRMPFS